MADNTAPLEHGWWEGGGRPEHLIDLALPHEDREIEADPDLKPRIRDFIATIALIAVVGIAVVLAFLWAVQDSL